MAAIKMPTEAGRQRERERALNCHCGCRVANQAVVKATRRKVIMRADLGWRGLTID